LSKGDYFHSSQTLEAKLEYPFDYWITITKEVVLPELQDRIHVVLRKDGKVLNEGDLDIRIFDQRTGKSIHGSPWMFSDI